MHCLVLSLARNSLPASKERRWATGAASLVTLMMEGWSNQPELWGKGTMQHWNHPTHRERERVKVNEHKCCSMHALDLTLTQQRQLTDIANAKQRPGTNSVPFVWICWGMVQVKVEAAGWKRVRESRGVRRVIKDLTLLF